MQKDRLCDEGTSSFATAQGAMAVLFWSTNVAFSRSLAETVGTFRSGAATMIAGGAFFTLLLLSRPGALGRLRRLPARYLVWCGGMFALNHATFYLAVGLSADHAQVLEVTVINYMWPGLTLALSVPVLGRRASPWLAAGMALALAGVALAVLGGGSYTWAGMSDRLTSHWLPYALGLAAALTWAFFSTLSRRYAGDADGQAMPLFIMATGLVLLPIAIMRPEGGAWSLRAAGEMAYIATVPVFLATVCWDAAMRRGNSTVAASLGYLTPLLSILVSALYLGVRPGWEVWAGGALTVVGAGVCRRSVKAPATEAVLRRIIAKEAVAGG